VEVQECIEAVESDTSEHHLAVVGILVGSDTSEHHLAVVGILVEPAVEAEGKITLFFEVVVSYSLRLFCY